MELLGHRADVCSFTRNFQACLQSGRANFYIQHVVCECQLLQVHADTWLRLSLILAILPAVCRDLCAFNLRFHYPVLPKGLPWLPTWGPWAGLARCTQQSEGPRSRPSSARRPSNSNWLTRSPAEVLRGPAGLGLSPTELSGSLVPWCSPLRQSLFRATGSDPTAHLFPGFVSLPSTSTVSPIAAVGSPKARPASCPRYTPGPRSAPGTARSSIGTG